MLPVIAVVISMLCCGPGEVIVANEVLNGTNVMGQLLGEGECIAHEPRYPLPQRIVEPLNMLGFPGQFTDGFMLGGRDDPFVDHLLIGVKHGVLTVRFRDLHP